MLPLSLPKETKIKIHEKKKNYLLEKNEDKECHKKLLLISNHLNLSRDSYSGGGGRCYLFGIKLIQPQGTKLNNFTK